MISDQFRSKNARLYFLSTVHCPLFSVLCSHSVLLNNGVAINSVPIPNANRNSRSR